MQTQVVVIGGGPGGYAAAFLAADEGKQVVMIEADKDTMTEAILDNKVKKGDLVEPIRMSMPKLRSRKTSVSVKRLALAKSDM